MTLHDHKTSSDTRTAWELGLEKMLAAMPARSFRSQGEADEIDAYLEALLEDGAGCGTNTWSTVFEHSAHRGTRSAKS